MKYTTTLGETIEYPKPTPDVSAFITRVTEAAEDPAVSENELITIVYGTDNPILEQGRFAGRGAVTKEVFANPVYHILHDLLQHKRISLGHVSVEQLVSSFSLTVAEAAERLEITPHAVRKAIGAHHLSAQKRGANYFIDPRSVDSYRSKITRRGPPKGAELRARTGNAPGFSLRIKAEGEKVIDRKREGDERFVDIEVPAFKQVAVFATSEEGGIGLVLEPAVRVTRFEFGPFWVEGKFKIVKRERDAQNASKQFKSFAPL